MKNLRLLRNERHISQQYLAIEMGLAQSQIVSYEKGRYEPDIETLIKLADYFHVSVDFLIGHSTFRYRLEALTDKDTQFLLKLHAVPGSVRRALEMMIDELCPSTI